MGNSQDTLNDNVTAISTSRSDVAALIEAEDHLQLAQFAIEHFSDGILWMSSEGIVVYVNDAACSMLNAERGDIVGRDFSKLVKNTDDLSWSVRWNKLKEQTKLVSPAFALCCHRDRMPVEVCYHYLHFNEREYASCFLRDVTDRRLVEDNYKTLKDELERQVVEQMTALREEIKGREGIEAALLDETEKLQSILDNAGQGFLTFGPDLLIDVQYSEECRKIFGEEVWGLLFPDVVAKNDEAMNEFLSSLLRDIFNEQDEERRTIFYSLLPREAQVNGRTIDINYRDIPNAEGEFDQKLMVVITDITETRRLQSQIEQDRNQLKMVVKAVTNYNELVEAVRDYHLFCSVGLDELTEDSRSLSAIIDDIGRRVHTFKGTFAQLDLMHVVSRLNDLETRITELRSVLTLVDRDRLAAIFDGSAMRSWLDQDMKVLTDILGSEFFSREEKLEITPSQLVEVEQAMISILAPNENKQLLPRLKRLRHRSLKSMLSPYAELVARLAERLQKQINPMTVEGDDIEVDPDLYRPFVKSLVHVFRNAVDHGMEHIDERESQGKSEYGSISCRLTRRSGFVEVDISDDGNGIDVERVRQMVSESGLLDEDALGRMTDSEAMELVFLDSISTVEELTEVSGRGIGLAAVKQELNNLGGTVVIDSKRGKGTRFVFTLPLSATNDFPSVSVEEIMTRVVKRSHEFMKQEMNVNIPEPGSTSIFRPHKIQLEEVVAIIGIKGALTGMFVMAFEKTLARDLVNRFAMDDLTAEEVDEYLDDTMSEIANIILGNSLNLLPEVNNLLTIGTPISIQQEGVNSIGFSGSEMWSAVTETEKGKFTLSLLVSEKA